MAVTLKEILSKCSELNIYEQREMNDDYGELVFLNEQLDKWNRILVEILGPPIKPAGVRPSENDLLLTKDYGGIFDNQVLFRKDFDGLSVVAMFWPWQDKIHTTLKIIAVKGRP